MKGTRLLQAIAFGLIAAPSLGLYWAGAGWESTVLMAMVTTGMLLALWAS